MSHMRILFVDDEVNVLDGLRRMLRSHRHEWKMDFVSSGAEALQLMSRREFNVVVSDMRMPAMDGGRLLAEIRRQYPDVVRIMLSGQSDRGLLLKSVGLAHQFLGKPCDPQTLKSTITRACRLRNVLQQDALRRLVSRVDVLPSLPVPYLELLAELRSPEASVDRVGRIIARDMGMTAKVLQLVNSAFFGMHRHVSDPATAASLLGLDTIKALVLSVQVFRQLDEGVARSFAAPLLWEHSVNVGAFAQAIARDAGRPAQFAGDALMAGMLHDIGKLLLASRFSAEWIAAIPDGEGEYDICVVEKSVFGATHAEVGAYLLGLWGMMDPIVEAVAFHHDCPRVVEPEPSVMTMVCAANIIDYEINPDHARGVPPNQRLASYAGSDSTEIINHWRDICAALEEEHLKCLRKSF